MKITHGATLTMDGTTTVLALKTALDRADIPDTARMRVSQHAGDAREPGYTTIAFTWETDV